MLSANDIAASLPLTDAFLEATDGQHRYAKLLEEINSSLEDLSLHSRLTPGLFARMAYLLNNASYIFLYLESNRKHIEVKGLDRHRERIFRNEARNRRLSSLVTTFEPDCADARRSKSAFTETFHSLFEAGAQSASEDWSDAWSILDQRARDKTNVLGRLGIRTEPNGVEAALHRMLARDGDRSRRAKLMKVWRRVAGHYDDTLAACIDRKVAARWAKLPKRAQTVTDWTLRNSRITSREARTFLVAGIAGAAKETHRLKRLLNQTCGGVDIDADFPRLIEIQRGSARIPRIPLQPCIDLLRLISSKVFGYNACQVSVSPSHLICLDMYRGDELKGRVNFDLWGDERPTNLTQGIRNGMDWKGYRQRPVAHVSCRFRRSDGIGPTINFQNAHSLFHEFGHALNHVGSRYAIPNISGLDNLPIERLEVLSMWFEKWVFHPEFGRALGFQGAELAGLTLCQEIKRLEYWRTHLERHVLALMDLDIHSEKGLTVRESYARIDKCHPEVGEVAFSELLASFLLPMTMTNPGGYVAYPWAAADSAERFAPFLATDLWALDDGGIPAVDLDDCFDYDAPSRVPNPDATFAFYQSGISA